MLLCQNISFWKASPIDCDLRVKTGIQTSIIDYIKEKNVYAHSVPFWKVPHVVFHLGWKRCAQATGNVGTQLSLVEGSLSVYVTQDGGATWQTISSDPAYYAFANRGTIIAIVRYSHPTHLKWSTDYGMNLTVLLHPGPMPIVPVPFPTILCRSVGKLTPYFGHFFSFFLSFAFVDDSNLIMWKMNHAQRGIVQWESTTTCPW